MFHQNERSQQLADPCLWFVASVPWPAGAGLMRLHIISCALRVPPGLQVPPATNTLNSITTACCVAGRNTSACSIGLCYMRVTSSLFSSSGGRTVCRSLSGTAAARICTRLKPLFKTQDILREMVVPSYVQKASKPEEQQHKLGLRDSRQCINCILLHGEEL
jgi:hypothetical protein